MPKILQILWLLNRFGSPFFIFIEHLQVHPDTFKQLFYECVFHLARGTNWIDNALLGGQMITAGTRLSTTRRTLALTDTDVTLTPCAVLPAFVKRLPWYSQQGSTPVCPPLRVWPTERPLYFEVDWSRPRSFKVTVDKLNYEGMPVLVARQDALRLGETIGKNWRLDSSLALLAPWMSLRKD